MGRLWLVLIWCACCATESSDLQQEDLQAVQNALRKRDASLDWFQVLAKKAINATYSVMVVQAAPTELRPGVPKRLPVPQRMQIGIFVVSGKTNQVRRVLDTYPLSNQDPYPTLEQPTAHAAYLHFYSDYGFYHGSIKYIFDLTSQRPAQKIRYGILALTSSQLRNGKLLYTASFGHSGQLQDGWTERHAMITIEPGAAGAAPTSRIQDAPAAPDAVTERAPLWTVDGTSVLIENKPDQPSGINVVSKPGKKQFYPVPVPTMELHRKLRRPRQAPGEINNVIGPFVIDRTAGDAKIWFANTFYDGEGLSGVGAVGMFDISTRKYEMRYFPQIARWSGSAMLLDDENLWIGLMRRPEGASYGAGLLRYNTKTSAVTRYAVTDYIFTIDRLADTIYCGTSHGLYTVRDNNRVTQFRFEPDDKGKLTMVAREVK